MNRAQQRGVNAYDAATTVITGLCTQLPGAVRTSTFTSTCSAGVPVVQRGNSRHELVLGQAATGGRCMGIVAVGFALVVVKHLWIRRQQQTPDVSREG